MTQLSLRLNAELFELAALKHVLRKCMAAANLFGEFA